MMASLTNWAGNIEFNPERFERPSSLVELQQIVASSERVRVLGTGHSFNEIADSPATMLTIADLPESVTIDREAMTVALAAGMRYAVLAAALENEGFALHNLGSLPHISVAGACATGTHGSGEGNGNLATAVRALEFVGAQGELVRLDASNDAATFAGAVVALGGLGVVTSVELAIEPTYSVRQVVYDNLSEEALDVHLDDILASAYSVSLFTTWREPGIEHVWCKFRDGFDGEPLASLYGAQAADVPRHPIDGMPATSCTEQFGRSGPWNDRLPHFRAEFTPSAGDELQSEYLLPRRHARDAIHAIRSVAELIAPFILISEIRTVASDTLWMSPSYEQPTIAFHFTWVKDLIGLWPALVELERVLEPFAPRPHWGKVFAIAPEVVRSRYPLTGDFAQLLDRFDPGRKFANGFVERYFPA